MLTKKTKFSIILTIVFFIFEILILVLLFKGDDFFQVFSIIYLCISLVFMIILILIIPKQTKKKCTFVVSKVKNFVENGFYNECVEFLEFELKKTFSPRMVTFLYSLLFKLYLYENNLEKALNIINNNKFVRESIFVFYHRVFLLLRAGKINEAEKIYNKWCSILSSDRDYDDILKQCNLGIQMCKENEFNQELFNLVKTPYIKELCLKYKKD